MNKMNDKQLELLIEESLADGCEAEKYSSLVSPFRNAVSEIIIGFIFTSITLNFLWLNYILPAIGTALLFKGLSVLRRGNGFFMTSFVLSILKIIETLFSFAVNVSPLVETVGNNRIFGCLCTIITILMLYFFGRGMKKAYEEKTGDKKNSANLLIPAVIWQSVILALALAGMTQMSWIIAIIIIIAYIFSVKCIIAAGDELEKLGYDVIPAPVLISRGTFNKIYFTVIILIVVAGSVYFNFSPQDWKEVTDTGGESASTDIRENLLDMGFPEKVLAEIDDEDLSDLNDVKSLEWTNSPGNDVGKIDMFTVAVRKSDDSIKWFVWFEYIGTNKACIADGVKITAGAEETDSLSEFRQVIKCSRLGKNYQAEVPLSFTTEEAYYDDADYDFKILSGKYSFMLFSHNQRGYITYNQKLKRSTGSYCDPFVYSQRKWLVLSYKQIPPLNPKTMSNDMFVYYFGGRIGEYATQNYMYTGY